MKRSGRRVVFVAPFGLAHKTTVWARTLPLARVLATLGYQPSILIPPWDSPQDAGRRWVDGGVEMVNVDVAGGLPAITARLLRELHRREPEIVHIVKPRAHAGIVQWLLWHSRCRLPTVPLLLDADDWEQAWTPINRYPAHVARFLAWQEEWGLRHADGITAASHWLVDRASRYTNAPLLYLPNGVDLPLHPAAPYSRPSDAAPTVLFFTRSVEVEPAWLADFAAALWAARPTARLVVAGAPLRPEGDARFRLAVTTRSPGKEGSLAWLGHIPPPTLPGIRAAAHVAIFPAQPVPLQQAKCSVRLATTLLDGVPVVASAVGEQAHFGADGAARLLPAGASPADFAAAVVALIDDPAEGAAMVARARRHLSQHYRWQDLGARLATFYDTFFAK